MQIDVSKLKDKMKHALNKPMNNNMVKSTITEFSHYMDVTKHMLSLYSFRKEGVLGVDITPNCIYVCEIDGTNGKRVLTSLTSVCMQGKFMHDDIIKNPDEYADSLKSLIKENNIEMKNVALSIPVSSSIVKVVTLPTMDDSEINNALKMGSLWNNFTNAKGKAEDYSIFYQVLRRSRHSETMDIMLVATKLSDISLYTDIVRKSGLNPVIVDVRCFAISNAFQHRINNPSSSGLSVFVEVGFEENYAMIIDGDAATVFDIAVKDTHRAAIIDKVPDTELFDEFIKDFSRQLDKIIIGYEERNNLAPITDVFVISSLPCTNSVIDKLNQSLDNYTILECNLFDCMKIYDDFTISAKNACHSISAWAASIAGAVKHIDIFGSKKKQLSLPYYNNLLPEAGKYEKEKRSKYIVNAMSAVASIAMLLFVAMTQGDLRNNNIKIANKLNQLNNVEAVYDENYAKNDLLENADNKFEQIISLVSDVRSGHNKLMAVHNYLNLIILEDVWLKELTFHAPDKFEMTGGSTKDNSIIEFMALLEEGNQFDKVALREMKEIREHKWNAPAAQMVKSFHLDGKISPIQIPSRDDINLMAEDINHRTM